MALHTIELGPHAAQYLLDLLEIDDGENMPAGLSILALTHLEADLKAVLE